MSWGVQRQNTLYERKHIIPRHWYNGLSSSEAKKNPNANIGAKGIKQQHANNAAVAVLKTSMNFHQNAIMYAS